MVFECRFKKLFCLSCALLFVEFLLPFAWFWAYFFTYFVGYFSDSKLSQCYFVSFFHLCKFSKEMSNFANLEYLNFLFSLSVPLTHLINVTSVKVHLWKEEPSCSNNSQLRSTLNHVNQTFILGTKLYVVLLDFVGLVGNGWNIMLPGWSISNRKSNNLMINWRRKKQFFFLFFFRIDFHELNGIARLWRGIDHCTGDPRNVTVIRY